MVRARPIKGQWILVQWQDRATADAIWEALDQFKEDFPAFQLEDELFRQAGGSVVDAIFGKKYSRKKNKEGAATGGPNSG
jgi:hypothetical protein